MQRLKHINVGPKAAVKLYGLLLLQNKMFVFFYRNRKMVSYCDYHFTQSAWFSKRSWYLFMPSLYLFYVKGQLLLLSGFVLFGARLKYLLDMLLNSEKFGYLYLLLLQVQVNKIIWVVLILVIQGH